MGLPQPLADALGVSIDSLLKTEEGFENALSQADLAMLRDFRWSLMALRADIEDSGDAPVFNDPEDLVGYLKNAVQ